ncbi:helix-turn-helix domain-containing protein [Mesorhizobium sp. M1328]|uniref:helix-turn-helix domain-containing protein n=1 Tax=Mesorhizobium sp. M1328 TaxID=2957082 RepID=UPI003339741F
MALSVASCWSANGSGSMPPKGDKTKYPGRKPTAMGKRDKIVKLDAEGMTRTAIAKGLGVSERSVYRALQGTGERIGDH